MKPTQFLKKITNTVLWNLLKKPMVQNTLVAVFYVAFVVFLLGGSVGRDQTLTLDEVATRTIQSSVQAHIEDVESTEKLRQEAENEVRKSYQEDDNALNDALEEVNQFFRELEVVLDIHPMESEEEPVEEISEILEIEPEIFFSAEWFDESVEETLSEEDEEESSLTEQEKIQEIMKMFLKYHQIISGDVQEQTERMASYLVSTSWDDLIQIENLTSYLVNITMSKPITEEFLENSRNTFMQQIVNTGFSEEAEEIVSVLGAGVLRANMIYDEEATENARQLARESVEPVIKTVKAGEIIVREGDRVTQEQIDILQQLGLQNASNRLPEYIGLLLFVMISSSIVLLLVRRYYYHIYQTRKLLYLVALVMVIILCISRLVMAIRSNSFPEIHEMAGFMAPVAACSLLIAIMIDVRLAYFVNMLMTLYLGIMSEGNTLATMAVAFISGGVTVYLVTRFSRTSDLSKSGIYMAVINMVTIFAFSMMDANIGLKDALIGAGFGIVNGILSAILTIGLLPYLENSFSITSTIRLLELADPNHPLLKRLLMEAPGTYHHSLMVGNLAEATARFIQADAVLVRVGSYYHDIGKIKCPEYFVENQQSIQNPHEKIAPALSAMIIIGHVRTGIQMAKQYKLPPQIIDFIASHHGTGLAGYFYAQAVQEDGKENVNQKNYRYDGPKPHSKEVALVMLADSVEAAVRSLTEPTREKIQMMVQNIIKGKLDDGQLDECDLTFHDLDIIAERFCQILENVYHKRIAYPSTETNRR